MGTNLTAFAQEYCQHMYLETTCHDLLRMLTLEVLTPQRRVESPDAMFLRLRCRPATLGDLLGAVRDERTERFQFHRHRPIACLGSVWVMPNGERRLPYLAEPRAPFDLGSWRLRQYERPFGLHWRFAAFPL